ncbi:hypothetical protein EUX52_07435 [Haemophilus haemolyticus]|uniref:Adhesin n=1 Tax=Haemophilus haemolyticus TaxID=726 RepID=A0A502LFS8_HAEHA|nr:YadA-like family protein [Haemophilus haemolyticus]TPH20643.1 hypothetical protein EUX52_07435 [Haemophilus haemolyticus]
MNKIFRIVWSQATQSWVVVSELTKAHKKQSSSNSQGSAVKFSGNFIKSSAIALTLLSGNSAYAALNQAGTGSDNAVALGEAANANQARAVAIGKGATISSGQDTIAIGTDTKAKGHTSIVIGRNAKTTNDAEGTVVIGRDAFSEGSGNGGRPNTVVGRGAYTAFGENGTYRLNAATALGFQAGAGLRTDPSNGNKLVSNETNADNNAEVLVKAGYGVDENAPADTKAALQGGNVNNNLTFYRKKHINEATAIGAEARAIGDQSIAIGGQVVAGDGVVALGGNDTDQLRNNKYQVVTDNAVNSTNVNTIDDYNLAYTESTRTVAGQYKNLVGRDMPTAYKSTYGQSGSVVIGMEAHSTTALGTAIGTNSVVRMGAFGATAIGAGSTVQPNADAAVAIGMGSVANGAYALAGGTASWADYGDIALGYQAKATGKDGAIAMGRATNAQGDSSIMIGGANIASAAAQNTSFEKSNGTTTKKTVTEKINGADVKREYSFAGTTKTNGTVAEAYKELTGITMDTAALDFAKNKNGHASTSLGVHALSKGDLGTAIGAGSRSDAIGSVALGTGAHATRQNAVAIGTGATTDLVGTRQLSVNYDSNGNIVSDDSKNIAYTFKWAGGTNTAEGDVVSFGSSGAERQLKNVAAGRVAEDSTDAINGSQLNSITKKIATGFNTSGNVVTDSSGVFTSKKADKDSAKKDYETSIRPEDKVQFQVGNNLKLDRNETESEIDDPDSPDKNNPLKKKIRKADFAYSLNPVLTNLTSAEFIGTGTDKPTTKLTNDGVTITPATSTGKKPVSLTENGLDNGGNPITNVAGNLDGAKTGTTAPTTKADKPNNVDDIKNNAATVGDVLNAGWNLKENTTAKDFVTAYDTVSFVNGDGTTVSVENTDGKTSTIKYSANLGDGLKKDDATNKITVNAADKSLTVGADGVKVNTGNINTAAVPTVTAGDENKIATVGNVAEAIKAAAWKATSAATTNGENTGKKDQEVKAGDTVTFEADKNIKIAQADGKFTFSTKDDVEFKSVKVGEDKDGKKTVNLTTDKATDVSNNDPANKPTTALNVSSDGKPTQITGVGSVLNTTPVTTTPDGSAPTTQPNVVNLGTAHGQTALSPNVLNSAATVRDLANMGWKISSDKATGADGKDYSDVVRNADEVKFVGKNAAKVSGKTDPKTGIRTITVDVEVPSVETAKITQNTDGSVTGPAGETLTKALKDAKDELAKLPKNADPAAVQAAQAKVDEAQKAIDNSPNSNKVATAQNVADMINNSGFTLKADKTEGDNLTEADLVKGEMINPGDTITMKAGKNMSVKHEKDGSITYATKDEVEFNTVKVGGDANTYVDDKGNPVTKQGDSFVDAQGNKVDAAKVSPVAPVTLKTEKASPANNNAEGNHPTTALNISSGTGTDAKPTQLKGVGSVLDTQPQQTSTGKQGDTPATAGNQNLVNLGNDPKAGNKSSLAPEILNSAATVGDLANMGWVVSTKDGNDYKDVVKNANQVDFKGTGLATVTGETDQDGIRTITVNVDAQKTVEAAQTPVVYTNKAGDKLVKVGDKFYKANEVENGKPKENAQEVPKGDVIASMNNGNNNTSKPMQLANIGSNLPTVNDTNKQAFDPNSTTPKAGKDNKSAPITAKEAADIVNNAGNNAATVSDVLNAGWNLKNNTEARDFVKPYDTVNFINGKGTVAVVETADDATSSTVKFDVDAGEITSNTNGSVNGPTTAENAKKLAEDLAAAQKALNDLPADADDAAKKKAQDALKAAQDAAAPLNKVATAQNVANMINQSGWNATSAATTGGEVSGTTKELINPSETVTFEAGKNISITQAENKFTFATKDNVEFNTVKVGGDANTYVDDKGNPVTKQGDDSFVDAKGNKVDAAKVNPVAPVTLKTEKASPANNNAEGNHPTTALNIAAGNKPTQLKGVGSVLDTKAQPTSTGQQGDTPATAGNQNLVNLGNNPITGKSDLAPEILNSAATVGDLANMGWMVSAKDNNYTNTVKNANKVEFKGSNGIEVTGKTLEDGTREITVAIADGKVTDKVTITKDGKDIPAIKIGDNYYEVDKNGKPVGYEVDEKGKPTANNKPIDVAGATITNEGNKVVTGNTVATAIQESGWNVGLADVSKASAAFSDKDKALSADKLEKVNPNDNVRFADGKGTKASVATVERVDEFGKKVTDTYVKFDIDTADVTNNANGTVNGPVTAEMKKALDEAKKALADLPANATPEAKKAAEDKVNAAQANINKVGNPVATAQSVANAINNSGWRTNSTTATGGAKDTLINPGKAVNFEAGKNMEVAQTVDKDGNVAYTYKTKDDVQFNSVQFGDANGPKITNNDGNINVSGADGKAPTKITGVAAGDISPNSTDAVNGAQIYALVGDQSNVNQTSPTYTKVDLDENGKPSYTTVNAPAGKTVVTAKDDNGHDVPVLKTYNVHSQKEIVTNSVVEAIHNMNEQGIKFFHSNDGVERPKQEQTNSFDSSASGKFATAIGSRSKADGTNAVAIGFNSVVTGNDSISIGTGNRVTGNNSGAFGDPSTVSGQGSYSVGNNNTVATNDTFVLGNEVKHTVENSAILGAKSTARGGNGSKTGTLRNLKQDGTQGASTTAGSTGTVSTATVGHMTYGGFQGDKADGVVSVGAAGNERRIQNVAAGEISKTSTDAINGSQLYAVAAGIGHKLGDLDNKINKVGKRGDAGTASALAAANIPQAYTPGKSLVGIAAGSYQGQNGLAVGMSRISDNGKIIIRLSGTANSQGKTGVAAGVGYQW